MKPGTQFSRAVVSPKPATGPWFANVPLRRTKLVIVGGDECNNVPRRDTVGAMKDLVALTRATRVMADAAWRAV